MQPNTTPTPHPTDPPDPGQVPAELLETVARALAAVLTPHPRQPEPAAAKEPDFLTAAQLAIRLGVSRETVRRLAIAGALPHTVVCRGTRKTTRRFPRRLLTSSRPAAWMRTAWPGSPLPGGRGSPRPHGDGLPAAGPQSRRASAVRGALA